MVDVVRVADGKLAEHWDVIQDEVDRTRSASGLPMYDGAFPAAQPVAPSTIEQSAEPSLLLRAFVAYLRARPADVDTANIRNFNDGQALEGISSYPNSLGGVPAVTLEPLVGEPERAIVYYDGGDYLSGSRPDRYLRLASTSPPESPSPRLPSKTWLLTCGSTPGIRMRTVRCGERRRPVALEMRISR